MSATFLNDDFLLSSETARTLFHGVAEHAPIVDLHNHLSPEDIAADRVYETLTDLWLGDDHYKWRAMRLAGFDEALITGDADPWEKFAAWAATAPAADPQPAVRLDAPRASPGVRDRSPARPGDGAGDLGGGEPPAAGLAGAGAARALRRECCRHHRRSGRRPRGASAGRRTPRGDDPDVPPRRGASAAR